MQTLEEYVDFVASVLGRTVARAVGAGRSPEDGVTVGIVAAASPVHSSGFGAAISKGQTFQLQPAPATLPLDELVQRLNQAQPPVLLANTTKLALLAAEQRAGRLWIAPRAISAMGELLGEEDRLAIGEAFGVPPVTFTQPLIRYELTDQFVGHPAASDDGFLRATVQGRTPDRPAADSRGL